MKHTLLLLTAVITFAGCSDTDGLSAPFEGHWRKYDDDKGRFIEFEGGMVTLGDKHDSRSGKFTFEAASEQEPLYTVTAGFSDESVSFQLYYESDTISLMGIDDQIDGLYEIIIELVPIDQSLSH